MSRERDDRRLIEDAAIMMAMYCDEYELTLEEGIDLADEVATAIYDSAHGREDYL